MSTLSSLKDAKTVLLTTYKRDGTPVDTAVSIAFDGDRAFFRSYDKAWKRVLHAVVVPLVHRLRRHRTIMHYELTS